MTDGLFSSKLPDSLRHFWVRIESDNFGHGVGERNCDGLRTTLQIHGPDALIEIVSLDDEIDSACAYGARKRAQ